MFNHESDSSPYDYYVDICIKSFFSSKSSIGMQVGGFDNMNYPYNPVPLQRQSECYWINKLTNS